MKKVLIAIALFLLISNPVSAIDQGKLFTWIKIGDSIAIDEYTIKLADVDRDFTKALLHTYKYGQLYRIDTLPIGNGTLVDNLLIWAEDSFKSEIYPSVLFEIDVPYFKTGQKIKLKDKEIRIVKANQSYAKIDLGYTVIELNKENTYYKDKNFEIKLDPYDYIFKASIKKGEEGYVKYEGISNGKAVLVVNEKTYKLGKGESTYIDDATLMTLLDFNTKEAVIRLDLVDGAYLEIKELPFFEGFLIEGEKVRISKIYEVELSKFISEERVEITLYRAGIMVDKKVLTLDDPYLVHPPVAIKFDYGFGGVTHNLAHVIIFADEELLYQEEGNVTLPIIDVNIDLKETSHIGEIVPLKVFLENKGDGRANNLEVLVYTDGLILKKSLLRLNPGRSFSVTGNITTNKKGYQKVTVELIYEDERGRVYRNVLTRQIAVKDPELTLNAKIVGDYKNITLGKPFTLKVNYEASSSYNSSVVLELTGELFIKGSNRVFIDSPSKGVISLEAIPLKEGNLSIALKSVFPIEKTLDSAVIQVYSPVTTQLIEKVVEKEVCPENATQTITLTNQSQCKPQNITKIVYAPVEKIVKKEVLPIDKASIIAFTSLFVGIVIGSFLLRRKA